MTNRRVQIIGDHPWTGFYGTVVGIDKPSVGILPAMLRVKLEPGQDCPDDHECYADLKNLRIATPIKRCFRKARGGK
jgi:hypothetical protein